MCNTTSELLSLQMPLASQKKVLSSFFLVSQDGCICMFNFTFMLDVGMGYVSLYPYT